MNLLPALTIGLSFGLLAGLLVYYIIGYFEANGKMKRGTSNQTSSEQLNHMTNKRNNAMKLQDLNEDDLLGGETTLVPSNRVVVVFNGRAKTMELQPLEDKRDVKDQMQLLDRKEAEKV